MQFFLPYKKIIFTAFWLLIFNVLAMWAWALFNVYINQVGYWPDVVLGMSLVSLTIAFSPTSPIVGHRKFLQWLAGLLAVAAGIIGIVYAFAKYLTSFNWIVRPLFELSNLLQISSRSKAFTAAQILQLTIAYILLSLVVIIFSVFVKTIFYDTEIVQALQRNISGFANKISRFTNKTRIAMRWRGSRILIWTVRTILLIIFFIFCVIGFAATVNAFATEGMRPVETRTFTGPNAAPYVSALLQSDDGTIYAGTGDGIFASQDGGTSWKATSVGLKGTSISSLLQIQDGTLYAGTVFSDTFLSRDGGVSWQVASAELADISVAYAMLQGKDGTLYIGSYGSDGGGVFVSRDGGISWQITRTGLENRSIIALLQSKDGTLYAGAYGSGVFLSRDGGNSWQAASSGLPDASIHFLSQGEDGTLYAGTQSSGLFLSRDGGNSWQAVRSGLTSTSVSSILQSKDGTLYAGTGDGVFLSRDEGASWQTASSGLTSTSVSSILQGNDGALYVGTGGGVFVSRDGGVSWQAANTGLIATHFSSMLLTYDGTLYAGTPNIFSLATGTTHNFGEVSGIFLSRDEGASWQAASAGLTNINVFSMLQSKDGTLYVGTDGSIFTSRDGGTSWQVACAGLTKTPISSMLQDKDGTLYAGDYGGGVFISRDRGVSWKTANVGLTNIRGVISLLQDKDGTLYAGTDGHGVFISRNGGASWQDASAGLANKSIFSMLQNKDGTLYAGTDDGIFTSQDGGTSWQTASSGLTFTHISSMLQDKDGRLYAGTDGGGVFTSLDKGTSWQAASAGLTNTRVLALLQNKDGRLYATTYGGDVFVSWNGGTFWQATSAGLTNASVSYILQDKDGRLYTWTYDDGVFVSQNGGRSWSLTNASFTALPSQIVLNDDNTRYTKNSDNIFISRNGGESWQWSLLEPLQQTYLTYLFVPTWIMSENTGLPDLSFDNLAILSAQSIEASKTGQYYYAWGATIMEIKVDPRDLSAPSPFWALRTWTKFWFEPRWGYFAGGFALLFVLWGMVTYGRATWALKVNPLKLFQARKGIQNYSGENPTFPVIQRWHNRIQGELLTFGNVTLDDLLAIPDFLRQPVLDVYMRQYEANFALQRRRRGLVLMAGDSLKNWQIAWQRVAEDFGHTAGLSAPGRSQVASLAKTFCNVLGFSLGEYREVGSTCAWRVEAPALRLNLPPRFPLVFVADPNPSPETVRLLFDSISILKEISNFTLVIALEPEAPEVDIPQVLRRVIDASPYAHDFVVLSQNDVLDILIARHPERVLVRHISRQVDLSFISPFVVNGPVPPQMFFGRDKEIRNLVDHAGVRNFAIVGNRKIGKTSLLNRVEARITQQDGIHLLRVDCQSVREAVDFYTAFESGLGIQLNAATPSALAAALRTRKTFSALPLVLMLDEVDALLVLEKSQGEGLFSTLRELATEHTCFFIFCGSKVLAQRLRDPESALFNFPEAMPLPYLDREEMEDVIIRPMETLGIQMQETTCVLDAIWNLTSGHPNLTQWVGRSLVNSANERQDRLVSQADVEKLWLDSAFVQFYFDTIWGAASPLEKLVTLLMPESDFNVGDVEKALAGAGADIPAAQVDSALEMLLVYSVLARTGRIYRFVPQAFHKLLDLNYEKERLIKRELEKLTGGGEK